MHYLAFVQRDETGAYLATLPDFPGCSATAPSWLQLEDAIRCSVRQHVETRMDHVPSPTPIELLTEDSAPADSCWMEVSLFSHEVRPPRTRRASKRERVDASILPASMRRAAAPHAPATPA